MLILLEVVIFRLYYKVVTAGSFHNLYVNQEMDENKTDIPWIWIFVEFSFSGDKQDEENQHEGRQGVRNLMIRYHFLFGLNSRIVRIRQPTLG